MIGQKSERKGLEGEEEPLPFSRFMKKFLKLMDAIRSLYGQCEEGAPRGGWKALGMFPSL